MNTPNTTKKPTVPEYEPCHTCGEDPEILAILRKENKELIDRNLTMKASMEIDARRWAEELSSAFEIIQSLKEKLKAD